MSKCINRITLLGRLGRDPKIFKPDDGKKFATLSLATSESWKDKKTGERKEKTEWHQVTIFIPHIVTLAEKYLRKGSRVLVEGKLQTHKWTDKNNVDQWTTEVVLSQFGGELVLLDKSPNGEDDSSAASSTDDIDRNGSPASGAGGLDDEIPY